MGPLDAALRRVRLMNILAAMAEFERELIV